MARKHRVILRTILATGEGETEQAFLKFLKQTYVSRGGGITVKVPMGKQGGDLSGDRKEGILLLGSHPCVEGLLLDIISPKERKPSWSSDQCKRIFEKKYLDAKKKLDSHNYASIIPKDTLEKARKRIPVLDKLLKIFEGGFEK